MWRKNTLDRSIFGHRRRHDENEMLKAPSWRCLRGKLLLLPLVASLSAFLLCFWLVMPERESATDLAKADPVKKIHRASLHRASYPDNGWRVLNTYPAPPNSALVDDRREKGTYLHAINVMRTSTVNAMPTALAVPLDTVASKTDRKFYWFFAALAAALLAVMLIAWVGIADRRQALAALVASEERYRLLFNANPLPIVIYDATTLRYVTANETFYHQYGYSAAELKDQRVTERHVPKTFEALLAEIQALPLGISMLKGGHHVKRDGTDIDVEVTRIRADIDGKPMVISSPIDVTGRVRAEQALKASEERYRLLFESNPLPLWVYDLSTLQFLDVNDVACTRYGYSRQEFMAMTMCDIRPPEDIAAFKQRIPHEGESRLSFGPWCHRRKDGSVMMVEINSHDVTIHGRTARFVCPIDVTEKLYAQEEIRRMNLLLERKVETRTEQLARSLALQQSLFDNVPQIVWLADLHGAVTFANRVWTEKIGLVADDWKDDGWSRALHPEDLERVMREWQQAASVKDIFEIEYRLLHRNGVYHDYQVDARRTFAQTGQPICWVGICSDVTVSRRREEALRFANQELEAFSYSVSHDLRAPLRTIDGFSERLQLESADRIDTQGRHYLDRIRAGAANMNKLIDDLLSLSQVTRGDMAMGKVDLSMLARQVFEELRLREPDHPVEIVIRENMTARGDAHLLRILFVNLIGNALKFSGKRGISRIEVGEATGGGKISTFFVRDNGAGFDPAYSSKMFGVFQRLHSAKEFPGTGIGLATVQRIVHRHGGQVSAQGALDMGATIHFSLRRD